MTDLERKLLGWTGPSSDSEKDRQTRTERMIREAIQGHTAFDNCSLTVFSKGSYPNNTNVRLNSDVDIAVQCHEASYSDGNAPSVGSYTGYWTPANLRAELGAALVNKFGSDVDTSGGTAIRVRSSSSRVEADAVPCFDYKHHFSGGGYREGIKVIRTDGRQIVNYPAQCYAEGVARNTATSQRYKKVVRILKRVAIDMESSGRHPNAPSFFIESLVFNCPNTDFGASSWTLRVKKVIFSIWDHCEGSEPTAESDRWLETNRAKFLFHPTQKWSREDGRAFAHAAWNHLGLADE